MSGTRSVECNKVTFLALLRFLLLALVVTLLPVKAKADSWAPPTVQTFMSKDGNSRVIITPRDLNSPLDYFRDKVKERDNPGLPNNAKNATALATVESRSPEGEWVLGWQIELINEIAPVSATVSDDGTYLATFDNWHSVGFGPSTIVYYKRGEGLRGQYDLDQFLPPYYLEALPRSVSSRSWKQGDSVIEDDILRFNVIVPSQKSRIDRIKAETVGFKIDLTTGHVSKDDTQSWINALLSALDVQKIRTESEAARIRSQIEPLIAKPQMTERDWHDYMTESYFRLVDAGDISATKHLRTRDHNDYLKSVQWVEDEFQEMADVAGEDDWFFQDVSIASSDQENLTQLLTKIASKAKPNDFRWGRLLVVVGEKQWTKLGEAFAHTGIKLYFADPAIPIPPSFARLKILFNPDLQKDDVFDYENDLE